MTSSRSSVSSNIAMVSSALDALEPLIAAMLINSIFNPFRAGVANRTISASGQPVNLSLNGRTRDLFIGKAA